MSLDLARPLLFVRALARVTTNHEDTLASTDHRQWSSLARMLGEFVSLLALVYLAEHNAVDRPYQILLGILFAFFLPTVLLHDGALRGARNSLMGEKAGKTLGAHVLVGALGVFVCYATYEGLQKLMDDWRMHGM